MALCRGCALLPLKPLTLQGRSRALFRMALLSGEVETTEAAPKTTVLIPLFRMALLSGEVET